MGPSRTVETPVEFDPAWLDATLRRLLHLASPRQLPPLAVAFSGGADSTALLAACAGLDDLAAVRAIHVDHGLHPDSADWSRHCEDAARRLGLDCRRLAVELEETAIRDAGIEAAAREARYAALAAELRVPEVLLTAQHQEDQLETVLLQLLRGSGLPGLAAMAPVSEFAGTLLLRPLLSVRRADLCTYLEARGIGWLEDPANRDLRFDRTYLRREIIPRLRHRWPAADASGARSAAHIAEGAGLLRQLAAADLAACAGGHGRLALAPLARLDVARQRNALRHWLATAGFKVPSSRRLDSVVRSVIGAAEDAMPVVETEDAEIRRYRGRLYLRPRLEEMLALPESIRIGLGDTVVLPQNLGTLRLVSGVPEGIACETVSAGCQIRFRGGGEKIAPVAGGPRRMLKKLFQEAGIVPWMRDRVPLLYCGSRLVAVADLWTAADCRQAGGVGLIWEDHPPLD